jgi:hypothetical protein
MRTFKGVLGGVVALSLALGLVGPIVAFAAGPAPVSLSLASHFAILAKAGISTTGSTSVTGDIGVSPAAATYITGFALKLPAASPFATSALVSGKVYAPGYASPTPANLTAAVRDMEAAYVDAAGRANPTALGLGAGNIGGMTLAPGLYKWGTGVTIPTDVTLSGGAGDVWIFQVAQNLSVSSAVKVILSGGANASNVFWAVAGQTTIGTTAVFNGNILDKTKIALNTGAKLNGRALAQTAVTLEANSVTLPSAAVTTPAPPPAAVAVPAPSGSVAPAKPGVVPPTAAPVHPVAPVVPVQAYQRNLVLGSKGTDVTTLQKLLISKNLLAWPKGAAYGTFSTLTQTALKKLQASWKLPVTGVVDARTLAALNSK